MDNPKRGKEKLFAGFLLNIFAVVVPAVLIVGLNAMSSDSGNSSSGGGVNVSIQPGYSNTMGLMLVVAMGIGLMIFIVGMIVYFCKNAQAKKTLAMVYLIVAIADLCLLVAATPTYVLATCGLGVIMYIPGILQIIAGTKFVSGSREYAA